MLDNEQDTYWGQMYNIEPKPGDYIDINLKTISNVRWVSLQPGKNSASFLTDINILTSSDGSTWNKCDYILTDNNLKYRFNEPVQATSLRIQIDHITEPDLYWSISELSIGFVE